MHDHLKDDSILLSGGAGDCKVYVTDVKKQTTIKSFSGHQGKKLIVAEACVKDKFFYRIEKRSRRFEYC
jgi:hypothetical protein